MVTLLCVVALLILCAVALTIATRPPDIQAPDLITTDQLRDVYVILHDFEKFLGREALKPYEVEAIAAFDSFYKAVTLGA